MTATIVFIRMMMSLLAPADTYVTGYHAGQVGLHAADINLVELVRF
jgi:hypothetical protein